MFRSIVFPIKIDHIMKVILPNVNMILENLSKKRFLYILMMKLNNNDAGCYYFSWKLEVFLPIITFLLTNKFVGLPNIYS